MPDLISDNIRGLKYRQWLAADPGAVILLIHGMGAHSLRWASFSEYLLDNNISSYAPDLAGFGENARVKGHISDFKTYYRDIIDLREVILRENPGKKVFILGESMGGLISFMLSALYPDLFDALICWSPAFANVMPFTFINYLDIFSALIYRPKKRFVMPFHPEMYTRDPEMQHFVRTDHKEHSFATPKLLYNILIAQIQSRSKAGEIKIPAFFQIAGSDKLVSPGASADIFKRLSCPDKKIVVYPDMYHALSIDLGRENVFSDTLEWVEEHSERK